MFDAEQSVEGICLRVQGFSRLTAIEYLPYNQCGQEVGIFTPVARISPLPSLCCSYRLSCYREDTIQVAFLGPFEPDTAVVINVSRKGLTDELGDPESLDDMLSTGQMLIYHRQPTDAPGAQTQPIYLRDILP